MPGDFPVAAQHDAVQSAHRPSVAAVDATDLPLVTLDPRGSRDLDQAVCIQRDGSSFVVYYAIADVASFVPPGSALDDESWRRGETLYFPDTVVPMLPPVLCHDAASLLPDRLRPALLWRIRLDTAARVEDVQLRRAMVRSRAQYDYASMQRAAEQSALPEPLQLLPVVGELLLAGARRRAAIDLHLPEQIVVRSGDSWTLELRVPTPIEEHNAQISLLTGRCAAELMLQHHVGVVRTVPAPSHDAVERLRAAAHALGVRWPPSSSVADTLSDLDRADPRTVALLEQAATLLRGAAYLAFDGASPKHATHAGIGAAYAHTTAPLRRLVDRYVGEVCLALASGADVPEWARTALPRLPAAMADADRRAHAVDRAVVDATEVALLGDRIGADFAATVLEADEHAATVLLDEPAVRARCAGDNLRPGARITVRLVTADAATRTVRFASDEQLAGENGDRAAVQGDPAVEDVDGDPPAAR